MSKQSYKYTRPAILAACVLAAAMVPSAVQAAEDETSPAQPAAVMQPADAAGLADTAAPVMDQAPVDQATVPDQIQPLLDPADADPAPAQEAQPAADPADVDPAAAAD